MIRCPVLFIHADNDKIINMNHSKFMHEARLKYDLPSEFFIQTSSNHILKGHNYFDYEKDVVQPIKQFLHKNISSTVIGSHIVLPRNVIDKYSAIPLHFQKKKSNTISREIELSDDSTKKERGLARKEINNDEYSNDDTADTEYSGIEDKLTYDVIGSWSVCCCVFCCEGCVSLNYHMLSHCYYFISGDYPIFDYQSLKPKDERKNSVFNLFNREAFDESPMRPKAESDRINGSVPVLNPLITNEYKKTSEKTSSSKGLSFIPG